MSLLQPNMTRPRLRTLDLRGAKKSVARSQRHMARKKKGSTNHTKAKHQSAVVQQKVANQRKDHHHQKARDLANAYDRIGIEDLAIRNMMRKGKSRQKSGLNRSIADVGWGKFISTTKWQFKKNGKEVVVFDAKNTTQTCSCCGAKAKPRIELSDRVFRCWKCGLVIGRDRNSAHNLNPDRVGPSGGTEPLGDVLPPDVDGVKSRTSTDNRAARVKESHGFSRGSSQ
jgi:putative transposase